MKTPDDHDESASRDLDARLRARLRDTTPDFERRFDDLRRRLAQEHPPRRWRWPARFTGLNAWRPWALFAAAAGVAAVLYVLVWHPRIPDSRELTAAEAAAYGDLVALDDALRDALPLADPEMLDAVLSLPSVNPG